MFGLGKQSKEWFENFVDKIKNYEEVIPLSFVLGFFVSNVFTRW
jgi:hypothetical protein